MNVQHVVPNNDLKEHVCDGETCWCEPTVEDYEHGTIIVHNSADKRELYESGERKTN